MKHALILFSLATCLNANPTIVDEKWIIREQIQSNVLPVLDSETEKDDRAKLGAALVQAISSQATQLSESDFLKKEVDRLNDVPKPISVYDDPDFISNYQYLLRRNNRIAQTAVGVREALLNEYKFCVAIGAKQADGKRIYFATGSLIAPNVVLTAAHVLSKMTPEFVTVANNVTKAKLENHYEIVKTFTFGYDSEKYSNDIAILILDSPASSVDVVPLADSNVFRTLKTVRAVGFGHNPFDNDFTVSQKRVADIPIASKDGLRSIDTEYGVHPGKEFVASDPLREIDTCHGDSGGPILTMWEGKWVLCGVTSRSTDPEGRCGDGGIYVRVDQYLDEIRQKMPSR